MLLSALASAKLMVQPEEESPTYLTLKLDE